MNIAVCVKEVPDTETRPRIQENAKGIKKEGIKWIVNPYDEYAIELGLQLVEKHGGEVTIVSAGPKEIEATIRSALAMGAHKAVRVEIPKDVHDPLVVVQGLTAVLKDRNFDMILFGKQGIDDDNTQVPQMVAEALELPCATVAVKVELEGDQVTAEREIEGGKEKLLFRLPAVISAQKGLNEPRYRSLKGIMNAKKIAIEEISVSVNEEKLQIESLKYPPQKPAGRIVGEGADAVPELVKLLKEEAKVI